MGYLRSLSVSLAFFACCFISSNLAYNNFNVGGKDGWVLHPSEPYNHWAERLRFQINDTLIFKYNNKSDSVLQVKKDNYYSCKTNNPIKSMTSGTSVFQFDRSGLFFFITGNKHNCQKGQKLIILVLSPRARVLPKQPSTPPVSAPSPKLSIPPVTPKSSSSNQAPAPAHSASTVVFSSSLMVSGITLLVSVVILGVSH